MAALPHPNATTSLVSGIGGGEAVVNIANQFGWHITTGWGITIAGLVSGAVLFVGRNGFAGVWGILKHGTASKGLAP